MNTVVDYIDNKSSKTIISFTGVDHTFISGYKKEFLGISKQSDFNVMFVVDVEKSWYNTVDVNKIKSKLTDQEVVTLGNSMGGYNAIQFANDINVTTAIAFAPQYSIHPEIAPAEKRWRNQAKKIKRWKHKHLIFNDTTEYYIFSGDDNREMYHTNMVPDQQNIHKFKSPGGHMIAREFKNKGILYSLIEDCMNNTVKSVTEKYKQHIKYIDHKSL